MDCHPAGSTQPASSLSKVCPIAPPCQVHTPKNPLRPALTGLSESLALETAPFNIHVLIVEPGAFRTNLLSAIALPKKPHTEDYKIVKAVVDKFSTMSGQQSGDPAKAAARIVEVVSGQGLAGHLKGQVLRLPLGEDCVERFEVKIKTMEQDLEKVREIAKSTNF